MDKDLYVAVDLGIERAKKTLRRHHDKITDKRIKEEERPEDLKGAEITENEIMESLGLVDEIVPHNLDIDKPAEIEEAINVLKGSEKHFIVFDDLDLKTRVLYKRTDGKFGIY